MEEQSGLVRRTPIVGEMALPSIADCTPCTCFCSESNALGLKGLLNTKRIATPPKRGQSPSLWPSS